MDVKCHHLVAVWSPDFFQTVVHWVTFLDTNALLLGFSQSFFCKCVIIITVG